MAGGISSRFLCSVFLAVRTMVFINVYRRGGVSRSRFDCLPFDDFIIHLLTEKVYGFCEKSLFLPSKFVSPSAIDAGVWDVVEYINII